MTSSEPRDPTPGRPKADSAKGYEGAPAWPMGQERSDRGAPFRQKNIPSPNDAARGAYARFIPREELNGFAAWQPGDLAGGPAPQANVQRAPDEANLRSISDWEKLGPSNAPDMPSSAGVFRVCPLKM